MKFLLALDFLGNQPSLYINSKKKFSTVYTAIISILVYVSGVLCVGYFGSELFTRTHPIVIVSRDKFDDFPTLNFSNTEFMLLFNFAYDNHSYYVDPTVYDVKVEY